MMIAKGSVFPTNGQLQDKVDDLAKGSMWLPPVKNVSTYQSGPIEGQIVMLDQNHFAVNAGKGNYQIVDAAKFSAAVRAKLGNHLEDGVSVSINSFDDATVCGEITKAQRLGVER